MFKKVDNSIKVQALQVLKLSFSAQFYVDFRHFKPYIETPS